MMKKLNFSLPLFYGDWLVPMITNKVPLTTVVGSPIVIEEAMASSDPRYAATVDALHLRYIEAVKEMHREYAPQYGGVYEQELEIWSPQMVRDPATADLLQVPDDPRLESLAPATPVTPAAR
jgi:hypothetical protein